MTPREQRDKIKALVGTHLLNALSTDEEKKNHPSASMLNVALSFLKATDPDLGQLSTEEIKQRAEEEAKAREEMAPLVNGRPFVYRIPLDGDDSDNDQTPSSITDESSIANETIAESPLARSYEEIAMDLVAQERVEPTKRTETTSFSEYIAGRQTR